MLFVATWMNLQIIILTVKSEKGIYDIMYECLTYDTNELFYKTNRLRQKTNL